MSTWKPKSVLICHQYLLENTRLVGLLLVISKLDLDLQGRKLGCIVHSDGMGSVKDCFSGLLVQQVELDRVPGVDVGVAVEVLPFQQQHVGLDDALLAQSLAVVNPVN